MNWYVQVQGQNYGPYSEEQMRAFASEGRINEHSLISNDLQAGFFPAIGFEHYSFWSGTAEIAQAVNSPAIQSYHPQQPYSPVIGITNPGGNATPSISTASPTQITNTENQETSVFLIMAEINSEGSMAFLQSIQNFGVAQRISDTVWLLRSAASVEQLRNTLSQTLNRQDRLFILDSTSNKPAWFNIGADLDHRIRDLWQEDQND
jgi:hypothetical protein